MFRHVETGSEVVGGGPEGAVDAAEEDRPNYAGDLDDLLGLRPVFRVRPRGYDRLQVDNYAAWAESELASARREVDHLLSRYGACSAELEISRRMLADVPRGRDVFPVSGRVEEMLRLAYDEAAAMVEAGAVEADRILAEARVEADARLHKAAEIKELAVSAVDDLREQARRERAEALALLERARADADEIRRVAVVERGRLDEEAAERRLQADRAAMAHLLSVQEQVDGLRRQRDEARQSLRQLTDQIGQALQAVVGTLPDVTPLADRRGIPMVRMVDNVVVDDRVASDVDGVADERVPANGRPQPVST
jgi:cell division septum initiation protein DivIVA